MGQSGLIIATNIYMCVLQMASSNVSWSLSTLPAIFGKDVALTCEIRIKAKDCSVRQWSGGQGGKAIMYNGITSKPFKYQEKVDLQSTNFSLIIKNVLESDVNVNYTCSCDFKSFKKKLSLEEKLFYYPPSETDVSFIFKQDLLKVSLEFTKVYPVPTCAFIVGEDLQIENMTMNFHHNGLVFNAKYTIEYRNNEEDCDKRPMVKCIFSSTEKAITINGNETFICPVVHAVNYKVNRSTNLPMFNYDDLPKNKSSPLEVIIPVCGIVFIVVTLTIALICIRKHHLHSKNDTGKTTVPLV